MARKLYKTVRPVATFALNRPLLTIVFFVAIFVGGILYLTRVLGDYSRVSTKAD